MTDRESQLAELARLAKQAEARCDNAAAIDLWGRYRRLRDVTRLSRNERIRRGLALSSTSIGGVRRGRAKPA